NQDVVTRRDALVQARKHSDDHLAALRQRQDEVKAADQVRNAAEKTRTDAQSARERHQRIMTSVDAALAATEAARQQLPTDATLSEASQKLKAKWDELRSVVPNRKARLDTATASLRTATDALGTANQALKASREEKTRRDHAVAAAQAALTTEEVRGNALRSELADATNDLIDLLG